MRNSYALRDYVPPLVVFVVNGQFAGRADLFFDSSQDVSVVLLSEWRAYHERAGRHPRIGVHLPLYGDDLLRTLDRLGTGSHSLARRSASYLSMLIRVVPFDHCFVPVLFLKAIDVETKGERVPLPPEATAQVVEGGWLSEKPQSPWSKWHRSADGKEEGFLSYAQVYPSEKEPWLRQVTVAGPLPTPQEKKEFSSLEEWLKKMREVGVNIVPVLLSTNDDPEAVALANRVAAQTAPKGLLLYTRDVVVVPPAVVPQGWWTLGASSMNDLRLE